MNSLFRRTYDLTWHELHFPRPLDPETAIEAVRAVATDPHQPLVVVEVRASTHTVRFLLGTESLAAKRIVQHLGATAVQLTAPRAPAMTARRLSINNRQRALDSDALGISAKAILSALSACGKDEELILQVVLGPRLSAFVVPNQVRQPVPLHRLLLDGFGSGDPLDAEARTALVKKVAEPGFTAVVRIGVVAATPARRQALVLNLLGALKRLEVPGVHLSLADEKPERLGAGAATDTPWRWPLRLNVHEVAAVAALPVGEDELPGLPLLHPKPLPPVQSRPEPDGLVVAEATAPGVSSSLTLSPDALLRHLHVIGPTGVGKSVLLENLIVQHLERGAGAVVIEPKGDLVQAVLARVPDQRRDDVVLLDPTNPHGVVGLNPLAQRLNPLAQEVDDRGSAELRADAILSVFTDLFGKSLGPRSGDILHACLLTLARTPGTSLVHVQRLLTDASFRSRLVGPVANDPVLGQFWAWYVALPETNRASVIAPLGNKLRTVLMKSSIRAVVGQANPKFDVAEVFTRNKILLVPLPVATLGAEGSALLGSLVVSALWNAAQARTLLPVEQRRPVMVCLDEFQNYCRLPDIEDALATSRSLGVGWVLAHQYLAQLPPTVRSAALANCRSRVAFQLAREDATVMAAGASGADDQRPTAADFAALPAFNVYASLFGAGAVQPYVSGRTLPPGPATSDAHELGRRSAETYGRTLAEIEAELSPSHPLRPSGRPSDRSSLRVASLDGRSGPPAASSPATRPQIPPESSSLHSDDVCPASSPDNGTHGLPTDLPAGVRSRRVVGGASENSKAPT